MNKYITYTTEGKILLPNIKKLIIPDEGYEIADIDLSGADIQVVAADSGCRWLLDFFSKPQDKKVYAYIASEFFQKDISDKSDEYKTYKGIFHGTNYIMGIPKLAMMAKISEKLARELQDFYFHLCPEIRKWHKRLEADVRTYGYVKNKFGRRMEFTLSRNNPTVMNEVAAAIPQSTIGDVVNRAWVNIVENMDYVDILMQTHDSLVPQYPIEKVEVARKELIQRMLIGIPYDPILYIDSDIKVSQVSLGDCKKIIY